MAITNLYTVKLLARLYDKIGTGAPTTATVGAVGEIYVDDATGLSYECTVVADPLYTWVAFTDDDTEISYFITKAEQDYLRIRGRAFATDDDDETVYPDDAESTAAEMVCYLMGIGRYTGRGKGSEGMADRNAAYDDKISGYRRDIVSPIKRYLAG